MKKIMTSLFIAILIFGCSKDNFQGPTMSKIDDEPLLMNKIRQIEKHAMNAMTNEEINIPELSKSELEKYNSIRGKYKVVFENHTMLKNKLEKDNYVVQELYPTGVFPDDYINIEAIMDEAENQGVDLELRLKSTNVQGVPTSFNFGQFYLWIGGKTQGYYGKIKFIGEKDNGNMTTFTGAYDYLRFGILESRQVLIWDRELIHFENIRFDGGHIASVGGGSLPEPEEIIIKDCHFINNSKGVYAAITTFGTEEKLLIEDCKFENNHLGIWALNYHDAIIQDNEFVNSTGGISIGNNASGNYIVRDNNLSITPVLSGDFAIWESGIFIRIVQDTSIDVYDNNIDINGTSKFPIFVYGAPGKSGNIDPISGINIYDNNINVDSDYFGAIEIVADYVSISNVCVSENKISGIAGVAYSSLSFTDKEVSNVTYSNNDIENFSSSCMFEDETGSPRGCAVIYFGENTNSMQYCGDTDIIIINQGTNNTFTNEDECTGCNI
ncbi:hypothetical protein [Aestuariivivens marinum]|uniref:hypothetical protein n=1 Tax=Aestuariivivens marinum TaxID=2913555 RepID=UPI001F589908|nr:hypothetical protein [Aestuariivivens marinum]